MDTNALTALDNNHYQHLVSEGFSHDDIAVLESFGVRSVSKTQALKLGIKKWNGHEHVSDGGLYFPFDKDYGQIRLNTPIPSKNGLCKYLGPSKPVKCWYPQLNIKAVTEGWKDAAICTVKGIPTAAIVGVDNIIYCLPKGCGTPIIFDSDGWRKPEVIRALVWGAIWTNGKINLFPEMPDYPSGGACEFFKNNGDAIAYNKLIDSAMNPIEFISEWITRWDSFDDELIGHCTKVAVDLSYALEHANKFLKNLEQKVLEKAKEWTGRQSGSEEILM